MSLYIHKHRPALATITIRRLQLSNSTTIPDDSNFKSFLELDQKCQYSVLLVGLYSHVMTLL